MGFRVLRQYYNINLETSNVNLVCKEGLIGHTADLEKSYISDYQRMKFFLKTWELGDTLTVSGSGELKLKNERLREENADI